MKTLILVLALTGCAYGNDYRPEARIATDCITAKDVTGAPAYHPCDPADPWYNADGIECTDGVQVGDTCYYRGQQGVAEDY